MLFGIRAATACRCVVGRIRPGRIIGMALALLVSTDSLPAQQGAPSARDTVYLDSVLQAHRYPVSVRDGHLNGSGALQRALPDMRSVNNAQPSGPRHICSAQ